MPFDSTNWQENFHSQPPKRDFSRAARMHNLFWGVSTILTIPAAYTGSAPLLLTTASIAVGSLSYFTIRLARQTLKTDAIIRDEAMARKIVMRDAVTAGTIAATFAALALTAYSIYHPPKLPSAERPSAYSDSSKTGSTPTPHP